jgi:hypothetical protein
MKKNVSLYDSNNRVSPSTEENCSNSSSFLFLFLVFSLYYQVRKVSVVISDAFFPS